MVLAFLAIAAAASAPPTDCTWMNTATASGILGGAAELTLKPQVCEWTHVEAGKRSILRVEIVALPSVATDYPKLRLRCMGPVIALKTLGNEAISCRNAESQTIIGRVRDQGFVISLSGTSAAATTGVRRAADQVTGNLF